MGAAMLVFFNLRTFAQGPAAQPTGDPRFRETVVFRKQAVASESYESGAFLT
jgi:hypothetical protein